MRGRKWKGDIANQIANECHRPLRTTHTVLDTKIKHLNRTLFLSYNCHVMENVKFNIVRFFTQQKNTLFVSYHVVIAANRKHSQVAK